MSRLPDVALLRFAGTPRVGKDVVVNTIDGIEYVEPQDRGMIFLRIDDPEAMRIVHRSFPDGCHETVPGAELSDGFDMVSKVDFWWPPRRDRAAVFRSEQPEPYRIGGMYELVPTKRMPLEEYTREMDRLKAVPWRTDADADAYSAVTEEWPPETMWPSESQMARVAEALRALSILEDEDDATKIYAGFMYINVCVMDTSIDQMLADRKLSELVLHALTHIVPPPPEEDITVDSDYYILELLLCDSLGTQMP